MLIIIKKILIHLKITNASFTDKSINRFILIFYLSNSLTVYSLLIKFFDFIVIFMKCNMKINLACFIEK